MLLLLLFSACLLLLPRPVTSSTDTFRIFCESEHLDSPFDRLPASIARRFNGGICTQKFRLPKDIEPVTFCAAKSPYNQAGEPRRERDDTVTCKWKEDAKCPQGQYVSGYCYLVSQTCPNGWTLMTARSRATFRWLSIFFGNVGVAQVAAGKGMKVVPAVYYRGRISPPNPNRKKSRATVALLNRFPAWGYYAGQLVHVDDENEAAGIQKLCQLAMWSPPKNLQLLQNRTAAKEVGPLAICGRRLPSIDGTFDAVIACNLFQPRLDENSNPNLLYPHEYCGSICEGCFAATQMHFERVPDLPDGRYYIPAASAFQPSTSDCYGKFNELMKGDPKKGFKALHHPKHIPANPNASYWDAKRPDNRCADQGRYTLVIIKKGTKVVFQDAPIFDRLPLVCISGPEPPIVMPHGPCMINSEPKGPNGECRCKTNFVDVLEAKFNMTWYAVEKGIDPKRWGLICIYEKCDKRIETTPLPWQSVLLLIDGSSSIINPRHQGHHQNWVDMQNFVYEMRNWLPNKLKILMAQYSSYNNYKSAYIPPGWAKQQFLNGAQQVMGSIFAQDTWTWTYMVQLISEWNGHKAAGEKALLIMITDGQPCCNDALGRPQYGDVNYALRTARGSNVEVKVVPVGSGISNIHVFNSIVNNPAKDIIPMQSYQQLSQQLKQEILEKIICVKITTVEFDDACRYA